VLSESSAGEVDVYSDLGTPALLGHFVTLEVPGVVHHELEVVVSVDGHGHVVVILKPFVN